MVRVLGAYTPYVIGRSNTVREKRENIIAATAAAAAAAAAAAPDV